MDELLSPSETKPQVKPEDKALNDLPGVNQQSAESRALKNAEPAPEPPARPKTQGKSRETTKASAQQPDDAALLDDLLKP